jgi:serine/threonine protein kinase
MYLLQRNPIRTTADWAVWRGEDPATGRRYLVKAARPGGPRERLAAWLTVEYRFVASLDHPNVLRPVELDPAGDRALFEDVQCSLAQYLAWSGPLPPANVANVLLQTASALEHLNGRRKAHGCVGPATLLVGPDGDVKLGDFLGHDLGTAPPPPDPEPRYLAPELMDAAFGRCGPAADLYALGFTALELLAGPRFDTLFGLPPAARWLAWHADPSKTLADWRPALPHVPAGLLDLIAGLIPKRPPDRAFQTAAQLRLALERSGLTSDQRLPPYTPVAPAPPPADRPRRPVRRIGPYVLEELIHRGSRGPIYLAHRGDRPVALRLIPDPPDPVARSERLSRVVALRDRHLVRVYRAGAVAGRTGWSWFAALEHMPNGSLRDRLRAGGLLTLPEALTIFRRAARGLAALHRAGLVHGNITPSAILFDARGRARLGDFYEPSGEGSHEHRPNPADDVRALIDELCEATSGRIPAEEFRTRLESAGRRTPAPGARLVSPDN